MSDELEQKHQKKMAKLKEVVDARIEQAQEERGVLIALKGNGKGKSSSAFGTMARALGHKQKCGVVQFIKGRIETGEQLFFGNHPGVDFHVMGTGFTWETQNRSQDIEAAENAWKIAESMLQDASYQLLVFDELTYLFKYKYLDVNRVVTALQARPKHMNVMITGRTLAREIADIADTISTVQDDKHAFRAGVKAQPGIEW
ncbi:cob(I)yrinic acid a,c-diamide adenosyltransferase [Aestuariirhabdus sp. Z084]|uniref:cob(I)yrinic acid a,c-diamide adenosyltransferase n=1 Tax=Aestuariirhabdus haliotis TaxID=2918751 RepID=UPI00201B3803|nr:cob(I)yrinic acid a,c-diamide adenosyltransferase [Aestuariirhabdus haliotis]MCL6417099.1 cob(I)yrinic acid a,c-diamide adenosyltransferase [Aestuariirhabdus haliotis]MCL6420611.1 cob(I)yrinic acid a,c-diamide adenosyltransferase [Aestuariirhabdus haliotis]